MPRSLLLLTLLIAVACGARETDVIPTPRVASGLLGRVPLELAELEWVGQAPDLANGRPTIVRFFTDECAYCRSSAPTFEALRSERVGTILVYHPKPPRVVAPGEALEHARALGYQGPVAADGEWRVLRALVPEAGRSVPTSVCLLLDGAGRTRWFHPGPELFASDVPADALANADYLDLRRAVQVLLAETDD